MTTETDSLTPPAPPPAEEALSSIADTWYVVGVLTFVYIFSFIDRRILDLLVAPIQRDLGISDTEMSLLSGTSFALFYTFFGILLGRLADTRSRRGLIAIGFAFWSLMTAGCGLAKTYAQMLLLRVGVGIGEAALAPAAYSLISDTVPKRRLSTAISVYSMGIYIGAGLAYIVGGAIVGLAAEQTAWSLPLVGAVQSWQAIFFIVGLPGVLFALVLFTIKEPPRRDAMSHNSMAIATRPSRRAVYDYLIANKATFLCHSIGFGIIALGTNASGGWNPTYLKRVHGLTETQAGIGLGTVMAIFGTLGVVAGGRMADWLAERGKSDATMRVGILGAVLLIPPTLLMYLMPNGAAAIAMYAPYIFMGSVPFGVAPAAIQQIMPANLRGQASAIYVFAVNLIGIGLGPLLVGLLTDRVFQNKERVHWSLLAVCLASEIIAALILWRGLAPFRRSFEGLDNRSKP